MIATGSVSAALKDPSLADTYTIVRQEYPHGKIIANIGAGTSVERAQEAIRLFPRRCLTDSFECTSRIGHALRETVILLTGKHLSKRFIQPLMSPHRKRSRVLA